MTRAELEHAIRAACDVSGDNEVYVFGSQAILGQYPDAPESLRQSAEADIAPVKAIDIGGYHRWEPGRVVHLSLHIRILCARPVD